MLIAHTLTPDHEAVKCLLAFGENALKYAAEVLATIEWGTQHWKLQESFPVPLVPKWLRMPEMIQTMMPLSGELPLIPSDTHLEDIHICSPALWAWMAVLMQYWQDHMTLSPVVTPWIRSLLLQLTMADPVKVMQVTFKLDESG